MFSHSQLLILWKHSPTAKSFTKKEKKRVPLELFQHGHCVTTGCERAGSRPDKPNVTSWNVGLSLRTAVATVPGSPRRPIRIPARLILADNWPLHLVQSHGIQALFTVRNGKNNSGHCFSGCCVNMGSMVFTFPSKIPFVIIPPQKWVCGDLSWDVNLLKWLHAWISKQRKGICGVALASKAAYTEIGINLVLQRDIEAEW